MDAIPPTHEAAPESASASEGRPDPSPRVIAMLNQKGGVGKTTSAVNLGAALANLGHRVLLIDLDPQAHLTLHLGLDPDQLEHSVYDLLTDQDDAVAAGQVVEEVALNLGVLPAEVNLAGVEGELAPLVATGAAQTILRNKTRHLVSQFDYVMLDCPPSLGLLTVNALAMAREVVVPMQAHFLALQGLSKLLETIRLVRQSVNEHLTVSGVVLCMHEAQTVLASEVIADLETFFDAARTMDVPWRDAVIYRPAVRRNIKLAECPSFGQSIFEYAGHCPGARDYARLAERFHEAGPRPHRAASAADQPRDERSTRESEASPSSVNSAKASAFSLARSAEPRT